MQEGWVKVHRAMLENAVMQDDWLCRLWMWCLLKARPASSQFKNERLVAGQFVTGRSSASEQLNVSPSKWYRGMQSLQELGCITAVANSNWTTVTVCNWTTYQSRKEQERTAHEQQVNNERTTDEQQVDTSKELKNLRSKETKDLKKEEYTTCSESAVGGSKLVDDSPVVMVFPTVGKAKEYPLTEAKLAEYIESYPGVDCIAAARAARQWCIDNPTRRKTFKGMPAFLSGWLGRNQNKGGVQQGMFGRNTEDPRGTLAAREKYLAMEGLTND